MSDAFYSVAVPSAKAGIQMNDRTHSLLKQAAKASKHAHQLHSSLSKMLHFLPEAGTWREMAQEARYIELRLESMLAVLEEVLQRDPETCAALLLAREVSPVEPTLAIQLLSRTDVAPALIRSRARTSQLLE